MQHSPQATSQVNHARTSQLPVRDGVESALAIEFAWHSGAQGSTAGLARALATTRHCRGDSIRNCDFPAPNRALYQTELHPAVFLL